MNNPDFTSRLTDINAELGIMPGNNEVSYTMSAGKSYNYDGDVLSSTATDITFSCTANTTNLDTLSLPWALHGVTWLANSRFRFVSYEVDPVQSGRLSTYTKWRETYRRVSGELAGDLPTYFDVVRTVEMPVWITKFWYWNNPRLGLGNDTPTSRRMRQVFGLTPVSGDISMKTFVPVADNTDPYTFINKTFGDFDGVIRSATVSKDWENGKMVYTINISWTGGKVGAGDIPTYTV